MSDLIPEILIADDDPAFRESLRYSLQRKFHISEAKTVEMAKAIVRQKNFDVAIVDLCFEGQDLDGVHLIDFLLKESPNTPIVILSGDSSTQRIVDATRRNHVEFVVKGNEFFPRLEAAIQRALQRRELDILPTSSFMTKSPAVRETLMMVDKILKSSSAAPILIYGETGTGKEHLAKYIAEKLKQKVVAANMASIPHETAESQLFGHERGAFTGAVANHIGLIEQANRGIFFLDELGECRPSLQAKLLRVIQEKEVQPVGSTRVRKIDVRFVAATHCNLKNMVEDGTFREDLYQRLNTFTVKIPALRDRPQDVMFYAEMFLGELNNGRSFSFDPGGIDALLVYKWPGNTRELKSVVQRIGALSSKNVIDAETVAWATNGVCNSNDAVKNRTTNFTTPREALIDALKKTDGNRAEAARILGIDARTVFRWIEKYGVGEVIAGKPGRPMRSLKLNGGL